MKTIKIIIAKNAGFCSGVERAIAIANEQLLTKKIYTLGSLIHNDSVVLDLHNRGASVINSLCEAKKGDCVLIRSHGAGEKVYKQALEREIQIVDATCPFVSKIHKIVSQASRNNEKVIIVGDEKHAEVVGIAGWVENDIVLCINSIVQASQLDETTFQDKKVCVVAQTTINFEFFQEIVQILKNKAKQIVIHNTICNATTKRQSEAAEISRKANVVFVLGGEKSSNTKKLVELCSKTCKNTYHLANVSDLALEKISDSDIIGLVAGASTPKRMIMEVVTKMNELEKNVNINVDNDINGKINDDTSFADAIEKTMVQIRNGQVLTGSIVQIVDEEVCVSIGYKSDGFIPRAEFSTDPDVVPSQMVKVGDEIEVEVLKVNDGEGNVLLSHKNVQLKKAWEKFVEDAEVENKVFDCVCKEVVKGGVITLIEGVRAFVPASQVSTKYVENLSEFVGQPMRVQIIEVDKSKRRVVASQKIVLAKEQDEKRKELWTKIVEGETVKGIVRRLTDFGAFVDIGGIDGLIHVTELAWGRVKHPSDVISVNDEVNVIILSADAEKQRVSLGYKQLMPKPWSTAAERFPVNENIEGKVVRIVPFGAFVSIEPTIDGLVHISQISTKRIAKVEDELKIGDIIKCKVLGVDPDAKRISLSRREVLLEEMSDEEREALEAKPQHNEEIVSEKVVIPQTEEATTSLGEMFAKAEQNKQD